MRRGAIVQLVVLAALISAAVTAIAVFIPWLPVQASEQRERIDFVFWFTTAICIFIFAVVASVSVYAGVKFRAKPDDDSDGKPTHGHTRLEIIWTVVPLVLVIAISVVSAVALAQNERLPSNHLKVDVTAQQFAWSFSYPGRGDLSTGELHLPVDVPVEFRFEARDVLHSFWVPQFGQKQDAVPVAERKNRTRLVVTPTRVGTYPIICTELCGLGHALMRANVVVERPAAFRRWMRERRGAQGGGGTARLAGRAVYEQNGCGGCHVFGPAGSAGRVGPSLDRLEAEARRANRGSLAAFTRESIVNVGAYIEPGYQNVMPNTFGQLPKDQLDALVDYLVQGARKGG